MADKNIKCLRCSSRMRYLKTEKIQLGQQGWFTGDLPNLIAGALEVDIFTCTECGKIEFFQSDEYSECPGEPKIAQKSCPKCGNKHDIDYPKCPFCKHDYNI